MKNISVIIPTIGSENPPSAECLAEGEYPLQDVEIIICRGGTASTARNAGIKYASSEKLVFLDDDSLPREDFLCQVDSALDQHAAVRGRVIHYGSRYGPSDDWYDLGSKIRKCENLIGCNMAVRREVIDEIGMFDSRLPYGHEETEWSERIRERFDIYYHPEMVVKHQYATSLTNFIEKHYRHGKERTAYYREIHNKSLFDIPRLALHPPNYLESPLSFFSEIIWTFGLLYGLLIELLIKSWNMFKNSYLDKKY